MRFKSAKQRKAVMAKIQRQRWQSTIKNPTMQKKSEFPIKGLIASRTELEAIASGRPPEVYVHVYKSYDIPKYHREQAKKVLKTRYGNFKDTDGDGTSDRRDCDKNDPKKQGVIHDVIAGTGKVAGYVGGEIVSGAKDVRGRMKTQYELTKEKERLAQEQRAVETEKKIAQMQQQYRQLKAQEVSSRSRRHELDATPISVKKTGRRKKRRQSDDDGWDDGSGSVYD